MNVYLIWLICIINEIINYDQYCLQNKHKQTMAATTWTLNDINDY